MLLERAELRMMAEIGWLASQRGMQAQALCIFTALERALPQSAAGFIGLAMAHMRGRALDEALRAIDRGLKSVEPGQHPELYAFRGLALQLAGRAREGESALVQAGDQSLALALRHASREPMKVI